MDFLTEEEEIDATIGIYLEINRRAHFINQSKARTIFSQSATISRTVAVERYGNILPHLFMQ